jgi:nucleoside phosphorylase
MIHFVVALPPEADALSKRYGMEPREGAFPWFSSEEAALVVSGVGKIAAAAAAAYLHARTGENPFGVWLNFGTAGHRDRLRGDVVVAHTVTDGASGKRWYPPRLDGPSLDAVEVRTVDRPESAFDSEAAYDMEASGFVSAALRFSTAELVQSIKIVSDNRETTLSAWTSGAVRDLVESRLEAVSSAVAYFREIARELDPLRREEIESRALLSAYCRRAHFTASESRKLRRLLQRWAALDPEASRESAAGKTASEILEGLERRVHALAMERSL